jgi:hypothetical protein
MTELEMAKEAATDLEYLKSLAKEGQQAPLLGGRYALMWGTLTAAALFTEWLALTGQIPLAQNMLGLIWLVMGVTGGILSAVLGMQLRGKPGVGSTGNRVSQLVWTAGGIAIFVYVMSIVGGVVFGKGNNGDFDTIMPMAFCIYAVSYFTTGSLTKNRGMVAIAMLAFVATLTTGTLLHQPIAYLVAAVFVVLTSVIPGFFMMRAEPSKIV